MSEGTAAVDIAEECGASKSRSSGVTAKPKLSTGTEIGGRTDGSAERALVCLGGIPRDAVGRGGQRENANIRHTAMKTLPSPAARALGDLPKLGIPDRFLDVWDVSKFGWKGVRLRSPHPR